MNLSKIPSWVVMMAIFILLVFISRGFDREPATLDTLILGAVGLYTIYLFAYWVFSKIDRGSRPN
jgi:hypothetical protein